jgi:zinc transporter ZupT
VECIDMPVDQRHHETCDDHHHTQHFAWLLDTNALGPKALVPLLLTIVLSVHSFIAGMALGVQESAAAAVPTLIAIVAHKWVEAISLGVSVVRVTPDRRILLRCATPSSIQFHLPRTPVTPFQSACS